MTLFAFHGVKSHGWTFYDPIKVIRYNLEPGTWNLELDLHIPPNSTSR